MRLLPAASLRPLARMPRANVVLAAGLALTLLALGAASTLRNEVVFLFLFTATGIVMTLIVVVADGLLVDETATRSPGALVGWVLAWCGVELVMVGALITAITSEIEGGDANVASTAMAGSVLVAVLVAGLGPVLGLALLRGRAVGTALATMRRAPLSVLVANLTGLVPGALPLVMTDGTLSPAVVAGVSVLLAVLAAVAVAVAWARGLR